RGITRASRGPVMTSIPTRSDAKTPFTDQQWDIVAEAKERALSTKPHELLPANFPEVRPQILMSWKRSMLAGVDSAATKIPINEDVNPEAAWVRVSEPIMDRLSVQVAS